MEQVSCARVWCPCAGQISYCWTDCRIGSGEDLECTEEA